MANEYEDFQVRAEAYLASHASSILEQMATNLPKGRWHPNGFAVFPLGGIENLGELRFHVWPRHLRIKRKRHPRVHCHQWHLVSYVVGGDYKEVLWEIDDINDTNYNNSDVSCLNAYNIRYRAKQQPDEIIALDQKWPMRSLTTSRYQTGELHCLPAGIFHETTISADAFVCTLLITSNNIVEQATILGQPGQEAAYYSRPTVSARERTRIHRQVKQFLPGF